MPDISTPFLPFTDGDTPLASQINRLTYNPTTGTPGSCEVINGQLNYANTSEWLVQNSMVRPRSLASGDMVGLTGNLDYTPPVFPSSPEDIDAYMSIPGATISFYLPYSPAMTIITWQVGGANAIKFGEEDKSRFRFSLDGVASGGIRHIGDSRHGQTETAPHKALRRPERDRVWSGHHAAVNLASGWHHASIGVHNKTQTIRL